MTTPAPWTARSALAIAMAALMMVPAGIAVASPPAPANAPGTGTRASFSVEPGLEYVAIAPSSLARYIGPLIDWKMDRGVPSQIFTLEGVLAKYGGRDDAERVHNFLQDLYYNVTDGTPRWLLIGGDSDQFPVRYLWANRDHSGKTKVAQNLYAGDMYFSGLGSDWDVDGDGVWGEPGEEDATPELYVGRIPASLPTEMDAAVKKDLDYELAPPGGDWFTNAFVAGALMDEPNYLADPYALPTDNFWAGTGFNPFGDNAWEVAQKVKEILEGRWEVLELADYPQFAGGGYTPRVDNLSHYNAEKAWDRGNSMVFWAAHGYESEGALADYAGDGWQNIFEVAEKFITYLDMTDPVTGGQLPLVYASACYVGQFDKDDTKSFEGAITSPQGGAIGIIAGDGDTFRMENITAEGFGNWWLSQRFFELVVRGGIDRPGQALGELKRQYHEYYMTQGPSAADTTDMDYFYSNLYAYNLLGDPEVPVWLGTPGHLALEVVRGAVANSSGVLVRVTDAGTGAPVAGATVHARGAGTSGLVEATTGADGIAVIAPGPSELGGMLRLAATGRGWVAARSQLQVGLGLRDLAIAASDIAGPRYLERLGDILTYNATVHNEGDFSASSITVSFDSGDTGATGTGGSDARYSTRLVDIAPGGSATVAFSHRYITAAQYIVRVVVDPNDDYAEADEGDNAASVQLIYRPLPSMPEQIGPFHLVAGLIHDEPIDLDAYVALPNGFPRDVSFELGDVTAGVGAHIDTEHSLQLRPGAGVLGSATVTVRLLVDGKRADEMRVLLEVAATNLPPWVSLPPRVVVWVDDVLDQFVNASDPEGQPLTLTTDLGGATLNGRALRWRPTDADIGSHPVTVTVTDPEGASATAYMEVVVKAPNGAPEFIGAGQQVSAKVEKGGTIDLPVAAQDPDRDIVSYYLLDPDLGFTVDHRTGLVTFDSSGLGSGTYWAIVVASDGTASSERSVSVEVKGLRGAPAVALLAAGMILLVAAGAMVLFKKR